jgi:two-component system NtrC family sensor kinase
MNRASHILVVEDSETQAFKLTILLEEQGWDVSVAGSGEAALAALSDPLPDLILVDYNLPGMRGDELCRRLRTNTRTRAIPILIMTATAPETAEIQSLESGADGYVLKTASNDVLLLRVRAQLRNAVAPLPIFNPQDADFRPARILAIDDSPTYLAFVCAELRNLGYQVESALSGMEGLRYVETERFDCVLVDMAMPIVDGIEVCQRISTMRKNHLCNGAVIILTGAANQKELNEGLEAGADDFVAKSGDLAVLQARIQALMRRKYFQEENVRIVQENKVRELEMLQARAGRELAEARAAMAEELVKANDELQQSNSRLKETQTQLIQTEKMASLGQLVAGIAHEINNPLAFVVNNLFIVDSALEALAREMKAHLSEAGLKKLQKTRVRLTEMRDGLDRVKELVLDLRTFSRLDEAEFKTVDVVEGIDAVLLLLKHRMSGRIVVERHQSGVRTLYCYAGRLNQVLMNLIANGIDAISGPGTLSISTSQTAESFLISIRDTGKGIPEGIRSKIFDPFFTTKPVGEGTGLGLAISYGIVQDHGGSIEVQSQEGVGTEFTIRIPLNLELRGKQ